MTAIPYSNRISIRDFLARRGIQPKYERNGYGMYLSPLREERTPSFKVDYVRNLWYDFGLGEGGTLLTLVMRLERCDSREAVRRLQNGEKRDAGSVSLSPGVGERPAAGGPLPVLRPATLPAFRILSDASLRHPALVGYLASRGIVLSVAAAFCREVRYEVNGRAFFAVGFRNDAGGWELRSDRFKGGSSPKHITTIGNRSDTVIAFFGAYFKVQQLIVMTVNGLIQGCLPIMRFNYGAGNRDRLHSAFRYGTALVSGMMILGTLTVILFPAQLLGLFTASEAMRSFGISAMRIMAVSYLFCGLSTMISTYFQATEKVGSSMAIQLCRQMLFLVPALWCLDKLFHLNGIWLAFPVAETATLLVALVMMAWHRRKNIS